jgi:hypothetical protein
MRSTTGQERAMAGCQQDINTIGTIIALLLFFIVVELGLIIFGNLRRQRPITRRERRGARGGTSRRAKATVGGAPDDA